MESWVADIEFERTGLPGRLIKAFLVDPLANYLPASLLRGLLRFGKSELAEANWNDPGGWQSMVISYDGRPKQWADKALVGLGSVPKALRNRRKLAGRLLARLIDSAGHEPVHVLCLGAGPGRIIIDAMSQATRKARATLVDVSSEAFDYGRGLAAENGLLAQVNYLQGDAREIDKLLEHRPDIVKMIGICEYLTDEEIVEIAGAATRVMAPGGPIVFNSLSKAHGSDRFFRRVFGLHMNHRTPDHLRELLASAGFGEFVSVPEPLGVYQVIVGRRQP